MRACWDWLLFLIAGNKFGFCLDLLPSVHLKPQGHASTLDIPLIGLVV
jgi:hypothetical protein